MIKFVLLVLMLVTTSCNLMYSINNKNINDACIVIENNEMIIYHSDEEQFITIDVYGKDFNYHKMYDIFQMNRTVIPLKKGIYIVIVTDYRNKIIAYNTNIKIE